MTYRAPVWLLVLLLAASLVSVAPAAHAQDAPTTGPTRLAAYFPSDAPFYLAAATDAATLETLGAVYAQLVGVFLPPNTPTTTFNDLLDAIADTADYTFLDGDSRTRDVTTAAAIRTWLGDSVAITVSLGNNVDTGLLAAEVRDSAAARAWLDAYTAIAVERGDWVRAEVGGLIYLEQVAANAFGIPEAALLADDVLLYGPVDWVQAAIDGPPADSLATTPAFQHALADLPAPGYSALFYLDYAAFYRDLAALEEFTNEERAQFEALGFRDIGATIMVGATRIGARSYALDAATRVNAEAYAARGLALPPACTDPADACALTGDTLASLLSDTLATAHVAGLRAVYDVTFDNLLALFNDPAMAESFGTTMFVGATRADLEAILANQLRALLRVELDDLLAVLQGEVSVSVAVPSAPSGNVAPFEFLLLAERAAAAAARRLVEGLEAYARTLTFNGEPLRVERTTDTEDTLVVRVTSRELALVLGPDALLVLEFVATGDALFIGTRDAVQTARTGDGGFLATLEATFPEAAVQPPPTPVTQLWVLSFAPLTTLADVIIKADPSAAPLADSLRLVPTVFDGALIYTLQPSQDLTITRALVVLAESE